MGSGKGGSSNTKGNNGGNGGAGGGTVTASGSGSGVSLQSIPAGSRKIVQSLKEIVNCPELEIYAMLKECNMDPNETVNRLLSQDPFHEVKSKRDKKKEVKDTSEFRSRGPSSTSNRGRGAADRYSGRGSSTQHSSSDSGALHGRPAYRKENGSTHASSLPSALPVAGSNISRRASTYSDVTAPEVKVPAVGIADNISSTPQTSSGYQPNWVGGPGQVSMADIVKMGKPKVSTQSNITHNINHQHVQGPPSASLQHNLQPAEDYTPKISGDLESMVSSSQHLTVDDEWPSIEHPSSSTVPPVSKNHINAELHPDPTCLAFDAINRHSLTENIEPVEDDTTEDHGADPIAGSVSLSDMHEENSGGASLFDSDLYRKRGSYQPHNHTLEQQEVENVSTPLTSMAANLQQLSIQKEGRGLLPEDNGPSVVIPDHLQVQTADCSHLSFGSFGSGISPPFSGPLSSMPVNTNIEEEPVVETDVASIDHSDTRNSEYYADESLRNPSDSHLFHRTGANSGNYDSASPSQSESLKVEDPQMEQGNQYSFTSAAPGYAYENSQLNIGFSQSQTSTQMQNLAAFPSVMPSYTNSLPNALMAANAPPGRDSDLPYSPFPALQSTTMKYGNTVSSISGPTISMAEALKATNFSSAQPTQQIIPGTSVATGPAHPQQHLAAHPYSQPTLPVGPFPNMIGYPFMHQSYAYMPSGFQQAFAGNTAYHQSLAAMLPQYKNSVSVSSLPQSAAVPSGYGGFGSTTTIPGNFPMNPPAVPSETNLGYDDVLSAQFKENSHLMSHQQQQNDSSGLWLPGPGSRTISAHPANTYYNYQGQQSQQTALFRQGQQPSQNYGALGYPNFYHSQTGISLDHQQQQNPRDGSLGGSQGQQPKQSQQLWQNTY